MRFAAVEATPWWQMPDWWGLIVNGILLIATTTALLVTLKQNHGFKVRAEEADQEKVWLARSAQARAVHHDQEFWNVEADAGMYPVRAVVTNASPHPVYEITAGPGPGFLPRYDQGSNTRLEYPVGKLQPGESLELKGTVHAAETLQDVPRFPVLDLYFTDLAGVKWKRSAKGALTEVEDY